MKKMAYNIWTASEATVKFTSSTVTVTTAALLDTFFGGATDVTGVLKDITIKEPIGGVDKVDLVGTDANGFQNAAKEHKPAEMVEISGTAILPNSAVLEALMYGTGITIGSATRYRAGKAAPVELGFLMTLDDGTDKINYAGINFTFTARETKLTGADGHFEVTFTAVGLPRDWFGPEF